MPLGLRDKKEENHVPEEQVQGSVKLSRGWESEAPSGGGQAVFIQQKAHGLSGSTQEGQAGGSTAGPMVVS